MTDKMDDKAYFAYDAISQSSLKTFIENRKAYEYAYVHGLGEKKSTKAMDLGTLNHCLLFEPEEFKNRYAYFSGEVPNSPQAWKFYELCFGDSKMDYGDAYVNSYACKSKSVKAITEESEAMFLKYQSYALFIEKNGHKEMITPELELQSRQMIEIVLNHPGVMKTLVAGRVNAEFEIHKELALIMIDTRYKRTVKMKIDEVHVDVKNQIIYAYDYKTTRAQNTDSFKGSAKYYGYDIQESFYSFYLKEWAEQTYGLAFQVIFRFIPQLNILPFNVLDVIEFEEDDREQAYLKWNDAFVELDNCLNTGRFDNPSAYSDSGVNRVKLNKDSIVLLDEASAF